MCGTHGEHGRRFYVGFDKLWPLFRLFENAVTGEIRFLLGVSSWSESLGRYSWETNGTLTPLIVRDVVYMSISDVSWWRQDDDVYGDDWKPGQEFRR